MPASHPLWTPTPERARSSQMHEFMTRVAGRHGIAAAWEPLREWAIANPDKFWADMLAYAGVEPSAAARSVMSGKGMLGTRWFEGMQLNYARHMLRFDDDLDALVFENEAGRRGRISHRELRAEVARCAAGLRSAGVQRGDRVAGFLPNIPETIIAMLGAGFFAASRYVAPPPDENRGK